MAEILVIGAGMVGVSTALALQDRGHAVTLADRRAPGQETSFGNAGVIQVEAAEPYPMPRAPSELLRHALGRTNDVTWSLSGLASMAPALWRYWRASSSAHHAQAAATYARLTSRATEDHAPLIAASGAENLVARQGLALVFRNPEKFEKECGYAAHLADRYGVRYRAVSGADWRREEPALRSDPVGAIHFTDSWSVSDPGALTTAYAALFEKRGGRIVIADAATLARTETGWRLTGPEGAITGETAVLCLGPWTGVALLRFGLRVPMVLKRGYHAHYDAPQQLRRPFLDTDNGVVLSSMRAGLRMTSGAALVAPGAPADPRQLARGERAVGDLVALGPRIDGSDWFGTRPCLPGMLPMVGAVPGKPGLWVNFGHGHQGFTLGPTTATLLAESIDGASTTLHKALSPATRL
ncbi:NAD(P)/FAD-dependent oxidoreductase [Marinibacterium profundimaris]|uniref:Amino acid dehydrogenase n=1 Tax=Marinibacterium profundimaris TaxID=1679460 RepID=A0A225NQH0_9RHOB|nr:FAD-dependent oxidoreductase [Marinibacterium profundimaris]OWU73457.1 amino acid dehydrogenase [Marinibacterium profundimaris]